MKKFNYFKYLCLIPLFLVQICLAAVNIQSRIDDGAWTSATAIYPLKNQTITLKVDKQSNAIIRWYQIFPDISKMYKNANHPWEENAYQWVGFGKIDYSREELTQFQGQWQIQPFEKQRDNEILSWFKSLKKNNRSRFYHEDVGSFWFQVEVEKAGKIQKSAGIENVTEKGLSPTVFRVSIRESDDFMGYLTSFFNVPAIFGSVTYQSNHYIGVDCADVLVAAHSKWKAKSMKNNYNVAMLVDKLIRKHSIEISEGNPNQKLAWGKEVNRGDFIAVKYQGARQYQHIGALYSDANENGILDGEDLVIHAGPLPLHLSYLKQGYFDGTVVILKPSNRL